MAVAIPILLAAGGAGAGAVIATSLVLGATGINSKVDAAASKVFGKGLVTAATIAGSAYLAFGSGLANAAGSAAAPGIDAAATAGDYVNAMDAASDVTNAAAAGAPAAAADPLAQVSNLAGASPKGALASMPPPSPVSPVSPTAPTAVAGAGAGTGATTAPTMLDKTLAAFKGLDPRVQASLIQVGGGALAGYGQEKQQRGAEDRARAYDQRYRSGSGLSYWSKPPTYSGG